ncbi:hypothetical protein B0H13DRAFT_2262601 [Mycena leptocephala]|nr:hypothetical protein B0H13DRAFT_2262601 [Mycena leptocephala]
MDKPSAARFTSGTRKTRTDLWQARTPRSARIHIALSIHPARIKSDAPSTAYSCRSAALGRRRLEAEPRQTHFAYPSARQDRRVKVRIRHQTVHEGKLVAWHGGREQGTGQGVMCKGRENGRKTNTDSLRDLQRRREIEESGEMQVTRLGYATRSDRETRWTPGPESIRIMGGQRVPHVDTNDGVGQSFSRSETHRYLCMRERRLGRSAAAPRTPACMGARARAQGDIVESCMSGGTTRRMDMAEA